MSFANGPTGTALPPGAPSPSSSPTGTSPRVTASSCRAPCASTATPLTDLQHRVSEIEVDSARKAFADDIPRNEARLVGVVREDPKTRQLESGAVLTTISLATKVIVNGKEREDWHSLTAWGHTAEAAAREIKAGQTISVNGPVRHRSVAVEGGGERQMSSIEVNKFQVLDLQRQRTRGQGLSV